MCTISFSTGNNVRAHRFQCFIFLLYYLARRQPVEPWSSSSSVKYLEGDAWLRALEQQLRLFKCTGLSIAHRLPVGIDVYIHFRLFSPLNRRNTFWKNIQSLKHASFYLHFLLRDFIFVFFSYRTQLSKTEEGGGTTGLNIIEALHAFFCLTQWWKWKFNK